MRLAAQTAKNIQFVPLSFLLHRRLCIQKYFSMHELYMYKRGMRVVREDELRLRINANAAIQLLLKTINIDKQEKPKKRTQRVSSKEC